MRTKKLWSRVISVLLVIALLPVSALAEYTAEPRVVTQPDFTVTVSHVNPEYERLGVKFTKPAADSMTAAQTAVNSLDEAADYLREQMENRVTEVTISVSNYVFVDEAQISDDWKTILYDAFEHTGVPTQGDYIMRHYGQSKGQIGVSGSTATFKYTITYDTTLEQENEVGDKIDELFTAWDGMYGFYDLSDYEQIEMIYDYICANVVYDYDNLNDSSYMLKYSAYAALIQGTAVCQGYANLFYRMALEAGVDNRIIVGDAGGAHAWNIVDMGEKYYYLDSTWDAPRFDYGYKYFLLGSDNFHVDHTPDAEFWNDEFLTEYPIDTKDFSRDLWLFAQAEKENLLLYFESVTPSEYLTRLDMAKLIVVLAKLELDPNATLTYEDCAELTDQEKQILAAVEKFGVMTAYKDGTFRPAETIDRARLALLLYRAMNGNVDAEDIGDYADDGYFTDVGSYLWYAPYVNYLAGIGVIPAWADKTFDPDDTADLRTALKWMVKAVNYAEPGDPTEIIASGYCGAEEDGTNLTWQLTGDGTLTISGEGEMTNFWFDPVPWTEYSEVITAAVIENGVTSIGMYAFYDCRSLASIEIPNSVTSIGDSAFAYCESLVSVTIPNSVTSLGEYAFSQCFNLTSVKIGSSVTSLGTSVFENCERVTSVTIPNSVTSIGDRAFMNCYTLTSVTIPGSVTSIGDHAFASCENLAGVTIPNSVTSIGNYTFSGCDSLASVTIPDSVTSIGNSAFGRCKSLVSVTIPNKVTSIGDYAFVACFNLASVKIGSSVTSIGDSAFANCESLVSVTIPNSVTSIGTWAFQYCEGLTSVTISNNLTSIQEGTFYACDSLASITIPNSVMTVGDSAFGYCESLTSVKLGESLTTIGNGAFMSCGSLVSITIPDTVVSIGSGVFEYCESLTSVKLSSRLTSISDSAFAWCESLTSVQIPAGVVKIGDSVFSGCDSLTSVTIPDSVTSIGDSAFEWCSSLVSVEIPDGVASINDCTFCGCLALTEVTIPVSVKHIGESAFELCDALINVNYAGTKEQWNAIEIGDENEPLLNAEIIFAEDELSLAAPVVTVKLNSSDKPVITWAAVDGAEKYEFWRKDGVDGTYKKYLTTTKLTLTHTKAEAGETYSYKIRAVSGDVYSEFSEEVTITVPNNTLAAPVVTVKLNSNDKPVISWGKVAGAEKYEFWRKDGKNGEYKKVTTTTKLTLTHTKAEAGETYSYKVRAVAGDVYSEFSEEVTITVPEQMLATPVVTVKLNSNDKPVISWGKVDGAKKYEFWRKDGVDGTYKKYLTTTKLTLTHTKAEAGETYSYKIRAVSGDVYSEFSEEVTITVPEAGLDTPTLTVSNNASTGKIVVTWSKVSGAEQYELWRSTSEDGTYKKVWTGTKTSLTHNSANPGETFYYKVRAVAGTEYSEFSTAKGRTCDLAQPVVTITLNSKGKPVVGWEKVTGATKYELWRSTSPDGGFVKVWTGTKTSVAHNSAESGVTYYYKVRALCDVSSATSAYSVVKSVTVK